MEGIGIPKIKHGEEKREKNPFEILTAELAGKTRDELTPEQREAEDVYRDKAFRDLMQLINDDEVLVHATENRDLENILRHGLLSQVRMHLKGMPETEAHDPAWQKGAQLAANPQVKRFLQLYDSFKKGKMSESEFISKREDFINNFYITGFSGEKVGRTRVRKYLEKILPFGFDNGWFDDKDDPRYKALLGGWSSWNRLDEMKPLATNFSQARKLLQYREQSNITGLNLISSSTSHNLKRSFAENDHFHVPYTGSTTATIFFDKPAEERMVNLGGVGTGEEESNDIGVVSKVNPKNFRTIQLNGMYYDSSNRIIYTLGYTPQELLAKFKDLQTNEELHFFDHSFQPLPPLESIMMSVIATDYMGKPQEDADLKKINSLNKTNEERINKVTGTLIRENHWDWYEKYGKKEK